MTQFRYLGEDIERQVGHKKYRYLYFWMTISFIGILFYRLERSLFLIFGNSYSVIRLLGLPIFQLIKALSNIDIHYKADVKGGILILHHSIGVVISGNAIIGNHITLTGGNVIGVNRKCTKGSFVIGNYCNLGANATIIGPLKLGDNIKIGASACVTKSFNGNLTLVGVPAREKHVKNPSNN